MVEDALTNPQAEAIDDLKAAIVGEVSGALAAVALEIKTMGDRINNLEGKVSVPDVPSFAKILQETVGTSKMQQQRNSTEINDGGEMKTIWDKQVLIIKPKTTTTNGRTQLPDAKTITTVLNSVPVSKCTQTGSGTLVVRLPTKKAKEDAGKAIKEHLGSDSGLSVTEPKKLLPKMTVVGISSGTEDNEIVPSILMKNTKIRSLVNEGLTLDLIFTKQGKDAHTKIAVIKTSPEIRSSIVDEGNSVYVGLTRCRAYDRFWVTQCYHCQGYGHTSDRCALKDDSPKCSFCAGNHNSKDCSNKTTPKCVNCAKATPATGPTNHFASNKNCPFMIAQRNKLIENTNFASSKN
ncbi:MAG: hypothetical protein GY781_21825 [Gammaproteobacteria bacterium]|nr:hypothetical protein [Gammaproteobacteria bacterium]